METYPKSVKTLGIIGASLGLAYQLMVFPFWFNILAFILLIFAVKKLSVQFKDPALFQKFLWGSLLCMSGKMIVLFIALGLIFKLKLMPPYFAVKSIHKLPVKHVPVKPLLIGIAGYIILAVGAYYLKNALITLSEYTKIGVFKIAGNLYFLSVIVILAILLIPSIFIALLSKLLLIASWSLILAGFVFISTLKDQSV